MVEGSARINKRYGTLSVKVTKDSFIMERILAPFMVLFGLFYIGALILPIFSLFKYAGISNVIQTFYNMENINCIVLSIATSLISLAITFIFGTAAAFYIDGISNKFLSKLLDILVEMPVVLPPAVAGIALLLTFGNNGFIGRLLQNSNVDVVFTPIAVIIAQFFVSSAFYVRVLKDSIRNVPNEIFEATYVLGAGKVETIIKVIMPMLKKSIVSGLILAWVRSMGEFGATLMFAGNIVNKTRTIPLQIYTFMQTDIKMATAFAAVLYFLSFAMLLLIRMNQKEE